MRPVGPRIVNTQPTTDTAIILDWYNKGDTTPVVMVDETAIGTLVYVVEIMMSNPYNTNETPVWASAGAGVVAAPGRYFQLPANATAARVRTTGGAGSVTYWVNQPGSGG
jgi:hypothetical protein